MRDKNIKYTMQRNLELQVKLGRAKRADERANGGRSPYIHSANTVRTYMQQTARYGDWLRDRGHNHATMDEARALAGNYIRELERDNSAWTAHTARSALARALDCRADDICDLRPRNPQDITRGRAETDKAERAERLHPDLAEACRSIGLRHGRELDRLTAADLRYNDRGELCAVHVTGKGGRVRDAVIIGERGRDIIARAAAARPTGRLFDVPDGANVHGWRADYAARCYNYALEHGITSGDMYTPRDGSGKSWDKAALDWVDEQLGHGEGRYYTCVYNYLSYGDAST